MTPLPVITPNIPNQRWSCHSCGDCCRTLVGHLTPSERDRLDKQRWRDELGVEPYVRVKGAPVLNKRVDGSCVFLTVDNRCLIHKKFGESAKPLACRIFPFSVRPAFGAWQASLRFDCPSITGNKGALLADHKGLLTDLVRDMRDGRAAREEVFPLRRGLTISSAQIDALMKRVRRWLDEEKYSVTDRVIGLSRAAAILNAASAESLSPGNWNTVLDLLFHALPVECGKAPPPATERQRGLLRQLAFAHAEHVSIAEMRSGLFARMSKRWDQLRKARAFRTGRGDAPPLVGIGNSASFDSLEAVAPAHADAASIRDLLSRYLTARIEGRAVFGPGYYGWPVLQGLSGLCLGVTAVGWLARYRAASLGRAALEFDDVARALGVMDRAATRLPALGTMAERTRITYLMADDGVGRLVYTYRLTEAS